MPVGAELRIESIEGKSLYNGDVEATEGIPIAELKKTIAEGLVAIGLGAAALGF